MRLKKWRRENKKNTIMGKHIIRSCELIIMSFASDNTYI